MADHPCLADFHRYDFFASTSWRWERVLQLADRYPAPGRATRIDDDPTKKARAFLLRRRAADGDRARARLRSEDPGLYDAHEIHGRSAGEPEGALILQ